MGTYLYAAIEYIFQGTWNFFAYFDLTKDYEFYKHLGWLDEEKSGFKHRVLPEDATQELLDLIQYKQLGVIHIGSWFTCEELNQIFESFNYDLPKVRACLYAMKELEYSGFFPRFIFWFDA